MSTATTPGQAKLLYQEPKLKLCEKVNANLLSFGNVASSIVNGREQHQPIVHATQNFVAAERHMEDSHENLKKLALLHIHLNYQYDAISRMTHHLEGLKEQGQSMRSTFV